MPKFSASPSDDDTTSSTASSSQSSPEKEQDNSGSSWETDNDSSSSLKSSSESMPEMTSEELETEYVVQDEKYKALYPDMLQAVIKNNSGIDVKSAIVAFAAWDSHGFPVKIESQYSLGRGSYVVRVNYSDVNMVDGDTYGHNSGLPLDHESYYDTWIGMYENKKLVQ